MSISRKVFIWLVAIIEGMFFVFSVYAMMSGEYMAAVGISCGGVSLLLSTIVEMSD